jgi:hypothetical protein
MTDAIKVNIEKTERNRIIYAILTESFPPDLRQLRDENPKKFEVSDLEIKNYVIAMSGSDLAKLRKGRLLPTFLKNSQAAINRNTERELEAGLLRRPSNVRIASRAVDFREAEVSKGGVSVDPLEETPAQRGNREVRARPKVSTASALKTPETKS